MIEAVALTGIEATDDGIAGWCGPVQLHVVCAGPTAAQLLGAGAGTVLTRLEVEALAPTLVGFADAAERRVYDGLRGVPGIGRASALAVLSAGLPVDVLRAAQAGEGEFFTQVPGIGATRAQAVIAHLARVCAGAMPAAVPVPVVEWVAARERLIAAGMDPLSADVHLQRHGLDA